MRSPYAVVDGPPRGEGNMIMYSGAFRRRHAIGFDLHVRIGGAMKHSALPRVFKMHVFRGWMQIRPQAFEWNRRSVLGRIQLIHIIIHDHQFQTVLFLEMTFGGVRT